MILSEEQSAGRGRFARSFYSPRGAGIYCSVVLRPTYTAAETLFITTCAAVAVAEGIERITGRSADIKWVNDVFVSGKKVCGILTEASFSVENGGLEYAVLGFGINVKTQAFPAELANVARRSIPTANVRAIRAQNSSPVFWNGSDIIMKIFRARLLSRI